MPPYVAVVGPSQPAPGEAEAAREVGRLLALGGAIVVTGGRGGAMEAACEGAKEGGGMTVGLLPGFDRGEANGCVDVAIPTGLGQLRNGLVVRAADAVVAVAGAYGTLSEIALALAEATPVVGLGTWDLARAGVDDLGLTRAGSPAEAAQLALRAAAGHPPRIAS